MSSKQRRERPCNTLGMPSTSSGFTHKPHIVTNNKAQHFYFHSNNFLLFIYGLPTLVNLNKRTRELVCQKSTGLDRALEGYMKHKTSIRIFKGLYFYYSYSRKLQSAKQLSTSHKITINKTALCTSENYNQRAAIKKKPPQKREKESRKIGEERYSIRSGT